MFHFQDKKKIFFLYSFFLENWEHFVVQKMYLRCNFWAFRQTHAARTKIDIFKEFQKEYLAVDNHRAVDVRSHHGGTESIKVPLQGVSRIANRNTDVDQSRELFLHSGNHFTQAVDFLSLNFALFLSDIDNFKFAAIIFGLLFEHAKEFSLIFFDRLAFNKKITILDFFFQLGDDVSKKDLCSDFQVGALDT